MATEKRMIEANTLREEISSLRVTVTGLRAGKGVLNECMNQYRESVLRIIDEQPTVDAVEVVHGRWIETPLPDRYVQKANLIRRQCSVCGWTNACRYKYCPNCGAKMDGGTI